MISISAKDFRFGTDTEALDYLREVVEIMMKSFGINREESLGRINESWAHVPEINGQDAWMYHELPSYWANHFYYGRDSFWWVDLRKREGLGLPPLIPRPYPGKE